MSEPPEPPRRPPGPQLRAGRSVIFAIILSLLIPGLGHLYAGRYGRALIWFAGALAIGIILNQEATIRIGWKAKRGMDLMHLRVMCVCGVGCVSG